MMVKSPFTVEEALEIYPASVVSALNELVLVNRLVLYVFGIVVEASAK